MQIARTSKFHIIYIMFEMTRDSIKSYHFRDLNVRNILEVLLKVFALKQIQEDTVGLYECGFFTAGCGKLIDGALKLMLETLRPQMIAVVEMRDDLTFTNTAIGNPYGDIYESLLDYAKASELNTGNPPPYYEQYMKPLIQGADGG